MIPFSTFVVISLLSTLSPVSLGVRRFKSNLVLYGGYTTDVQRAVYTDSELEDWKNLSKVAEESRLGRKLLLCGVGDGAWLAYPKEDFKTDESHNFVKLIVGGACISADYINSAQPVGSVVTGSKGLFTFQGPLFSSEATKISNDTTTSADNVGSFISSDFYSGEWLIEGDGKKFCVVRPTAVTLADGVCIMPDLETELGIKSAKVTVGCQGVDPNLKEKSDVMFVELQTCFESEGAYRILSNFMRRPEISTVCSNSANGATKLGFQKIVDAWKFRMDHAMQAELNPADIDRERDDPLTPMRLQMLSYFFDIFKQGCSTNIKGLSNVVPEWYFNLIRYLYMQHLKSVWVEVPTAIKDRNDSTLMWTLAHDYLQTCHAVRLSNPIDSEIGKASCSLPSPKESSAPAWETKVMDLLLEGDELDHVVEQVWMMLNYVSTYCAGTSQYRDNLWAEFVTFFRRNFLLPLMQQWLAPGAWQVYYQYMFNGVTIDQGKRYVISCVQDLFRMTPGQYQPIDRPSALVKDFLSLSKKHPTITTTPAPSRQKRDTGSKMLRRTGLEMEKGKSEAGAKKTPTLPELKNAQKKSFPNAKHMQAEETHRKKVSKGRARGARV